MQYMLLIFTPEDQPAPIPQDDVIKAYASFGEDARLARVLTESNRLQPVRTAASVRVRNGSTTVTDGPFAETKEQLAGYYILDCKSREEAIEYAAKIPGALHGTIEVRPIWEM